MAAKLIPTPSQTDVGPFFHIGLAARPEWSDLTAGHPQGDRIAIEGRVVDGDGAAVPDALIEVWQANAAGRYDSTPTTPKPTSCSTPSSAATAGRRPTATASTAL